jgi:MoxR-like ATPase
MSGSIEARNVQVFANKVQAAVEEVIVGKPETVQRVISAILCSGHVLFEDFPGLGKTLLARTLAAALNLDFRRIQFTPDLLPADITGGYVYNREAGDFELRKGPVFTNILLADEINRASPKTQSALLEAMQEGQVTIEGESFPLPKPFVVLATQNPIEYEGTFPLPEAQLDRFLVKLSIGYPDQDAEVEILRRRRERRTDEVSVAPVTSEAELTAMRELVEEIFLHEDLERYIVSIVSKTRTNSSVSVGASPRGSLALMKLGRAIAAAAGRTYVVPDDIKEIAIPALRHRLVLTPELWMRADAAEEVISTILTTVPVPVVSGA